ncbi:MAG: NAD(P)H-dependent oxidoreductase subunit E [Leptotrichiaceae bacterium]|nr:NAD(P)H-dependent oxidoreductase subunit E [Leptotrichiaceae bacterium]MBP6281547.1 NAD(P)H-dependent oxidoreductase subunit E [Leptotrichiaceae bacterium]MBP7100896.1 NAD(P)H-dependent oxidoreductase subunit E [Leptotrichiaceae bacterium]MBP7725526.1 NAD(P)H-dependent oxidoreductase subunit E [Leptotrichiaceae bacterium]MBP9630173.1 NAD(P)H-dependent oxidoreductase subunit E [Leptotrichiaceae bacterium]
MCSNILKEQGFRELEEFIDKLETKEGSLIAVLHKAQNIFGYLPKEVQEFIAEHLDESLAHVYGVVSFYSYFTMVPKGEHPISVCMGTACYVRGADKVLEEFQNRLKIKSGETTLDGKFSIDALRCVGACGIAPVVLVGEKVYKKVEPKDVAKIISEY